jgi:hypothetical protein
MRTVQLANGATFATVAAITAMSALCVSALSAQSTVPARTLVAEFRIDGNREELNLVMGSLPLSNGDLLVMTADDPMVRVYARDGSFKKGFLRKGAGPGEARSIGSFGLLRDTLWTYDYTLKRLSFFAPDGSLLRSVQSTGAGPWRDTTPAHRFFSSNVTPIAVRAGNVAIGQVTASSRAQASGEVRSQPLVRMTWDGIVSTTIDPQPQAARAMMVRVGDSKRNTEMYGQQPYDNSPVYGVSEDGKRIAIVDMTRAGNQPIVHVTQISPRGDTLLRATVPFTPVQVTNRMVDSTVKAIASGWSRPGLERDTRAALYVPRFIPPVRRVLVANDGTMWLRTFVRDGTPRWLVLSPQGRPTMTIDLPKNFELMSIEHGVWGVERDADDVPSVVRYRIGQSGVK